MFTKFFKPKKTISEPKESILFDSTVIEDSKKMDLHGVFKNARNIPGVEVINDVQSIRIKELVGGWYP